MNLPISIMTTTFTVNGRELVLDTARLEYPYAMKGIVDFETMLLDRKGNSFDEKHARNEDDAVKNHLDMVEHYTLLFGCESVTECNLDKLKEVI